MSDEDDSSDISEDSSIQINASNLADEIKDIAREVLNEEELKTRVEHLLRNRVFDKLGIEWARYEYTFVSGKRADALYGHVIIEYESPHTLESDRGFSHAVSQAKDYITEKAGEDALDRYYGIVFDGLQIGFVRYTEKGKWQVQGPFDINKYSLLRALEAIRGLRKKALDAKLLIKDFGPESKIAQKAVNIFYNFLLKPCSKRTEVLFDDWKRVFSQVCAYSPDKIQGLEQTYGLEKDVDPERLLFSVHTFYALIMKLLAAETATLFGDSLLRSYFGRLQNAYLSGKDKLKEELRNMEEGGIFSKIGIKNFLEADYFSWYLDEERDEIIEVLITIISKLSEYEVGVAELEPERIKDLFKKLYQRLVPGPIRHDLGEYYTPDWLAEFLVERVGYEGDPEKRVLDPACGSGTFLITAIHKIKTYVKENFIDEGKALEATTKHLIGFDLNPLAVIASRANYLIALGDWIRHRGESLEIPIYLADSILVERTKTLAGTSYILNTNVGEFVFPKDVIQKERLGNVLDVIEDCVKNEYSKTMFQERIQKEIEDMSKNEVTILSELFKKLSILERSNKDRIWTRILRNSFAPLFVENFDYVIGNPPWIAWENVPKNYRDKLRKIFEEYKILPEKSQARTNIDISMVFTYRSMGKYLKDNGMLGFLIPETLFSSIAGEGFRRFFLEPSNTPIKVLKSHNMVSLQPFESAQNKTAMIIAKKGEPIEYPIPYYQWKKKRKGELLPSLELKTVKNYTEKNKLWAEPIGGPPQKVEKTVAPWIKLHRKNDLKKIRKIVGKSIYKRKVHVGVDTMGANGVFFINLKRSRGEKLVLKNQKSAGRKDVKEKTGIVEKDLVYPIVLGKNVSRWKATPREYIIIPHNSTSGKVLPNENMTSNYPNSYNWLRNFKEFLEARKGFGGKSIEGSHSFYTLFKIRESTFYPYKVIWKEHGKDLISTVIDKAEVPHIGSKVVIPEHNLLTLSFKDENEAHYVCAFLNSSIAGLIVSTYAAGIPISTHVLDYVKVPKYDSENEIHQQLATLSKKAHHLTEKSEKKKLMEVEKKINILVAKLYGLNQQELMRLEEFKKQMAKQRPKDLLKGIPGIGDKTIKNILDHFGDIENVEEAEKSELTEVRGIGKKTAEKIYREFQNG